MRSLLPLLALPAAAALAVGLASPSSAAIARTRDAVDHSLPAYSDLTGLKVRNGPHLVVIDLHLRSVRPDRTSAYALISSGTTALARGFSVGTQSSGHGHHAVLIEQGDEDSSTPVRCRGLEVDVDAAHDLVHIVVPHRCLTHLPGALRVSGLTEETGDGSDEDETRDLLVPRG